mmetsp:Transcript_25703/g.47903  ORF Transcript_25703/g.47903 Transcript_25703/m.47903 type:complete len:379 (-) Transcript_25703:496-1632(-)
MFWVLLLATVHTVLYIFTNRPQGKRKQGTMENGKSLSKNLLYTPLEAYHDHASPTASALSSSNGDDSRSKLIPEDPSQYMNQKSSVPKHLHEASFVEFMHSVSHDYHRNRATAHDAKNNGSRPLTLMDFEDRIRQRAVTLLGGGINSSIPVTTTSAAASTTKKRRRRSWEKVRPIIEKQDEPDGIEITKDISFLLQLNASWNKYIWKLLGLETEAGTPDGKMPMDTIQRRFDVAYTTKDENLELVGAHIRIERCKSHKTWAGRFGVLVEETTNTYRVVGRPRRKRKAKNISSDLTEDSESTADSLAETSSIMMESFLVPKHGSLLMLIVPVPPVDHESGDYIHPNHDSLDTMEPEEKALCLIPLSEKSLAISLRPSNE